MPKGIRADGQPQKGRPKAPAALALRKKAMLAALERHLGIVTHAAREIGIDRNTHYAWMKDDPDYRLAAETINEAVLDFGETALFRNVKAGKEASIIFLLKCRGRQRGYIERLDALQVNHSGSIGDGTADLSKLNDEELQALAAIQRKLALKP